MGHTVVCALKAYLSHKIQVIDEGFVIDRSLQSIRHIALALADPDTGEVVRKKGDYSTRQGVFSLPNTSLELTNNIPVCHAKMRSLSLLWNCLNFK